MMYMYIQRWEVYMKMLLEELHPKYDYITQNSYGRHCRNGPGQPWWHSGKIKDIPGQPATLPLASGSLRWFHMDYQQVVINKLEQWDLQGHDLKAQPSCRWSVHCSGAEAWSPATSPFPWGRRPTECQEHLRPWSPRCRRDGCCWQ